MMNTEEIRISIPWGTIGGKAWGVKSDVPVLMLHGLQDNAGTFDNLIPLLPQKGFYYICIDLPGHGQSSCYPAHVPYMLMNYVDNLRIIVVEYLKLEKFYLIGHSMGSHVAYFFTGAFPERVIKFIGLELIIGRMVPTKLLIQKYRERIAEFIQFEQRLEGKKRPEYSYEEAVHRLCKGRMFPIPEDSAKVLAKRSLVEFGSGYVFTTDPRLKLNVSAEFSHEQYKCFIDNIDCPITIIYASDSIAAFRTVLHMRLEQLFKNKKNFKHFIVEGTHDVHLVNPEKVSPIISRCLLENVNSKL